MFEQKVVFITGGTSGLGKEAVNSILNQGHKVYLLARSSSKLDNLLIQSEKLPGKLIPLTANLNDLQQVTAACNTFLQLEHSLDALVNNAGVWEEQFKESKNGIELTLQVNLIVPALLIKLLSPALLSAKAGKIINTASALHIGQVNFQDLEYRKKFSGFNAYRQSKLGLILLTKHLAQNEPNLGVYAFHPGVVSTDLGRNLGWFGRLFFSSFGTLPQKGADTLLYLLNTDRKELLSGAYYYKRKTKETTSTSNDLNLAKALYVQIHEILESAISNNSR